MFVCLFIMGMFLPNAAAMLITVPIFFPLALAVGISPLWLGVFYVYCGETALLTPPVGLNLFVLQGISKCPMKEVVMGFIPYILILLGSVVLITVLPILVEWLPSKM